jgi:dipeptidyl aminopeptidase/acylaminoacyl peptidase
MPSSRGLAHSWPRGLTGTTVAAADEYGIDDMIATANAYDRTTLSYLSQFNTHSYSGTRRADLRALAAAHGKRIAESPFNHKRRVPERYRARSPLHFVANITGRLLIVQGLQDPNVTPENVRVVRDALDQAGVPYEVLAFEDQGHGIGRPKNQKTLYPCLAEFFRAAFAATP